MLHFDTTGEALFLRSDATGKRRNPGQACKVSFSKGILIKKCHIVTPLEKLCLCAQMRLPTTQIPARAENCHFVKDFLLKSVTFLPF